MSFLKTNLPFTLFILSLSTSCSNHEKQIPLNRLQAEIIGDSIRLDSFTENGIYVIPQRRKYIAKDTFSTIIGTKDFLKKDSLYFIINGVKKMPDKNGHVKYEYLFLRPEKKIISINLAQFNHALSDSILSKRLYHFATEFELWLENENGNVLYHNKENLVSIHYGKGCISGEGPRLKIENGRKQKTGGTQYRILPNEAADTCKVKLSFCNFEKEYVYPVETAQ